MFSVSCNVSVGYPVHSSRLTVPRVRKDVPFGFMFKSIVGLSIAALVLVGVVVPLFGIDPPHLAEGGAALVGGIIGALLGLRALASSN